MKWIRGPRYFSDRISGLVTLTTAAAVIAVSFALVLVDQRNLRSATRSALQAQTDIAALNSGAPLVFGDRVTATEVLQAFRAMPSVDSATLFTLDGTAFAQYRRDPAERREATALPVGLNLKGDRIVSVTTVQEKDQALGRLQVVYDLSGLNQQLWQSLLLAISISLGTIALALLVSRHLAKVVTRPLAQLTNTARQVSETRDYALRAPNDSGDDEIGAFIDTFNEMLAQIERQDHDINAAREHAETASRLKDEFLATLSHELRTPMTPILGWSQILQRIAPNPQVAQAAEVIERNALTQTRLVDDLLDMSRIISGKIRLDLQQVQILDVLSAATEAVRAAAHAREITLDTALSSDLSPLVGDPHRLQQVLWNLLSNAIKFTPPGGHVQVTIDQRDSGLEIVVGDSGQGIPAEFLPYVFERFRQVDSSITRAHGGLGLGLAIVKQLVELHGGTVSVASPGAGHGARFTVHLPVRPPATATPGREAVLPPVNPAPVAVDVGHGQPLRGLRLLVVDNEADARDWLQQVLGDCGAQVHAAGSAEEALRMLQADPPDALVSDIGMPGTDGYALIRQVRALPAQDGGGTPAIALTAFARNEDRTRALAAGYQMHLGKPVDREALVAAILSLAPSHDAARPPSNQMAGSP
jgi:signal transduction histidine kinase/ActR/RegA family two-component response regulator